MSLLGRLTDLAVLRLTPRALHRPGTTMARTVRLCIPILLLSVLGLAQTAPSPMSATAAGITIPRLSSPPRLEDFLTMKPESETARAMAHVDDFRQWTPQDGLPVSQPTHAYLGYDAKNLYVVF